MARNTSYKIAKSRAKAGEYAGMNGRAIADGASKRQSKSDAKLKAHMRKVKSKLK